VPGLPSPAYQRIGQSILKTGLSAPKYVKSSQKTTKKHKKIK